MSSHQGNLLIKMILDQHTLKEKGGRCTLFIITVEAPVSGHPQKGNKKCQQLELATWGDV